MCSFNRLKGLHEKLNWMFSGTAQVSHQVCQFFFSFFVSSVCLLVRSCNDLHASMNARVASLLFILEDSVPWDAIVLSVGKLRKLWDSLSELAVLYVKDGWKGQFWGLHYCLSKLRSVLSFSVRYDVTQQNRSV